MSTAQLEIESHLVSYFQDGVNAAAADSPFPPGVKPAKTLVENAGLAPLRSDRIPGIL
jgi:hypothetical protein